MTDWAEGAAKKALEQKVICDQNTEKANREAKIKAESGPRLFQQLIDWLTNQVAEYNKILSNNSDSFDELVMDVNQTSNPNPALLKDRIVVSYRNGRKNPLIITYSTVLNTLSYECGGGRKDFTLKVGDDGQPFLEGSYHIVKTIEEIGAEALSKFMEGKF